ncbi:CPBP family intramembrane metalloprotease [Kamptonema cortianum]|nr:CPBP family intramembrane metalloprotease [Geitlerinema splendidum]MDK3157667.1 CPBP family intramembrane metalloprotease [Kamptonema cortianum]
MESIPPPVLNEGSDLPDSSQVNRGILPPGFTWVILGALVSLICGLQLYAYFAPQEEEARPSMTTHRAALNLTMRQTAALDWLSQLATAPPQQSDSNSPWKDVQSNLEPIIGKSPEAARYHALISLYLKKQVDPKALKSLEEANDAKSSKVLRLVEGESLESEWDRSTPDGKLGYWLDQRDSKKDLRQAELVPSAERLKFLVVVMWSAGLILLGGVTVLIYGVSRLTQKSARPGFLPQMNRLDGHAAAGRVALYLGIYFFFAMGLGALLTQSGMESSVAMVIVSLGMLLLLPFLLSARIFGVTTSLTRLIIGRKSSWMKWFGIAFLAYAANFVVAVPLAAMMNVLLKDLPTPSHEAVEMLAGSPNLTTILSMIFLAAVFAPIIEEVMFRGQLYPAMKRFMPIGVAVVLQGVIFAVIHPQGPILWPALAIVGVTAAILSEETGSLVPAILMHALHNGTLITFNLLLNG